MKVEIKYKTLMGTLQHEIVEAKNIQFTSDNKMLQCVNDDFDDVTYYNMEYIQSVHFIKDEKEKQVKKD